MLHLIYGENLEKKAYLIEAEIYHGSIHSLSITQKYIMDRKHFDYYAKHEDRSFSDQKQVIIYSYNNDEKKIIGAMIEKDNLIFLYEYRGEYVGTEFFISFSKNSSTYKLIKVDETIV